jgi:hypothetical protein
MEKSSRTFKNEDAPNHPAGEVDSKEIFNLYLVLVKEM